MPQRVNRKSKQEAVNKIKNYASSYQEDNLENFESFAKQLSAIGLKLRHIPGDGNCLFRALGDQLDGNSNNHLRHREETVDYMLQHRNDFEPFVEDDLSFDYYINNLRKLGTYAGNDAIVAFARNNNIDIVIHQLNAPLWTIKGSESPSNKQLHISYHNGDHYSSVRKSVDSAGASNIKVTKKDTNSNSLKSVKGIPDSMASYVAQICMETGCKDESLVYKTLKEVDYDQTDAVARIFELMDDNPLSDENDNQSTTIKNTIWDKNGSGTRLFGSVATTVEQRQRQLSNKKRKEQARRERKKRSEENKRNNRNYENSDEDGITANLSMLHI